MEKKNFASIIESLLFIAGEPVKISKLKKITNLKDGDIEKAITDLKISYEKLDRGLFIIRKDDYVQLTTHPQNAAFVKEFSQTEASGELSRSSLEVLSIIAYRGPVSRSQIEAIRGVNSSHTLRALTIRGLIEREESTDSRGYLYRVSFELLKKLGIDSPQGLPDYETLSKNNKIDEIIKKEEKE